MAIPTRASSSTHSSLSSLSSLLFYFISPVTIFLLLVIPYSTPLEFNYPSLEQSNPTLITQGNITYLGSELQLTTNQTDQIGRVRYFQSLHLWDNSSGKLAEVDFVTNFSFSIYSSQTAPGDGIAFFLAKPPFQRPDITDGSGLGLVGTEELYSSSNPFVAVEFDTFRNKFDPPDYLGHVGVNVNSMISNETTPWACNLTVLRTYNATVSYVSRSKNLTVTFTGYAGEDPFVQSLYYGISLADYLPEWVNFGFSAANGLFTSRHILHSWSFKSILQSGPSSKDSNRGLVLGLSIGGCFLFVTLLGFTCFVLWRKIWAQKEDQDDLNFDASMDNDFEKSSGARKFSYDELLSATNNFSEQEKLGQGGFGVVYRGFITSLNSYVAIKRVSKCSSQGLKEYASEVKIISRLRHKNLVELIGWCHRKGDLLLVYEFMSNGSLDSLLFKRRSWLTWETRYNIAYGLALALLYLHEECEKCVLHRDIKASNVMLDSHLNAKLGDFGLARLVDHKKGSQTTILAGTIGYMAPECVMTGKASKESDVYSLGVVALEIACGTKAVDPNVKEDNEKGLVEWVWELYGMELILEAADPKLFGEFDRQQMERLLIVGLWCAHPDYCLRPSIKQAIHVLDSEAPLPILASKMPVPTYLSPLDFSSASFSPEFGRGNIGTSTADSTSFDHNDQTQLLEQ
ncbi:Serine/threonine protein kinase [Parasponia andersonii]|uniref:non-specific serine/threonine protein kinase n=1 Tax=Parasponia andersonii TaxID=3476 RepID=A0A2P5DEV4_PARAD|nr:Serine/threonine protein kinase [Parasponia andersonii]